MRTREPAGWVLAKFAVNVVALTALTVTSSRAASEQGSPPTASTVPTAMSAIDAGVATWGPLAPTGAASVVARRDATPARQFPSRPTTKLLELASSEPPAPRVAWTAAGAYSPRSFHTQTRNPG